MVNILHTVVGYSAYRETDRFRWLARQVEARGWWKLREESKPGDIGKPLQGVTQQSEMMAPPSNLSDYP
jgi:hypothetical protein